MRWRFVCLLTLLWPAPALLAQTLGELQAKVAALESATRSAQSAGDNAWRSAAEALKIILSFVCEWWRTRARFGLMFTA